MSAGEPEISSFPVLIFEMSLQHDKFRFKMTECTKLISANNARSFSAI